MKQHFYPALFLDEDDGITVTFPDIPEAITCGSSFDEAYHMAIEALGLALQQDDGTFFYPSATNPRTIVYSPSQYIVMIPFDEIEYLKKYGHASIKKTLTIPQWLNTLAIQNNINFSQVLQEALKEKLNIQ